MFFWFKSFHIIFIICWFAGLFYTPRIFVYIAESNCEKVQKQLLIMAKRLLYFITPFALLSIFFGIILLGTNAHYYIEKPWFICKLFCVFGLVCYHISCFYFLFSLQSDCKVMRNALLAHFPPPVSVSYYILIHDTITL